MLDVNIEDTGPLIHESGDSEWVDIREMNNIQYEDEEEEDKVEWESDG